MCRRYFNIKKGNISEDLLHALRNVKELQQLHFISEQHIYSLLLQRSIRKGWLPLSNCFRKFEEDKQCSRSSERSEEVEDAREAVLVDCRQEELATQWKLNASDAALPLNSGGRISEIMIAGIGPAPQAKARMYSSVNERHMSGRVIAMPRITMHVAMQANEPASNGLRPTRSM
jgi:hypothetical protein